MKLTMGGYSQHCCTLTSELLLLLLALYFCRYFFRQIVEGLSYCHRCHIAHRDLKLSNFLLTTDKPMRCGDA